MARGIFDALHLHCRSWGWRCRQRRRVCHPNLLSLVGGRFAKLSTGNQSMCCKLATCSQDFPAATSCKFSKLPQNLSTLYNPLYCSTFHFLFHYPHITPKYSPIPKIQSPELRPDPEAVSMLCSMGFAQNHVQAALRSSSSQPSSTQL